MDPTKAAWSDDGESTVLTLDTIEFQQDGTIRFQSGECKYEGKDPEAIVALMQHGQERAQQSS